MIKVTRLLLIKLGPNKQKDNSNMYTTTNQNV